MRLYEATGMGALLITDKKSNLNEIFEIDREVLAYSSPTEAKELVRWAAENPAEARSIAEAGNRRTLGNYTYESVLAQLEGILSKLLSGKNRE
jgi:spore maturation protein CgeB